MTQANELRIGNWVLLHKTNDYSTNEYYVVDAIDIGVCVDNNKRYSPIPLTPEILEKAGFVAEPNKLDVFSRKRLRIWFNGRGAALCYLIEEDTTTGHYIPIQIQHLHQLQNLYFALTGEELEINL